MFVHQAEEVCITCVYLYDVYISIISLDVRPPVMLPLSSTDATAIPSIYPLNVVTSMFNSYETTGIGADEGEGGVSVDDTRITDPLELSHKLLSKLIATLKGTFITCICCYQFTIN